jgi:hypothetical protein
VKTYIECECTSLQHVVRMDLYLDPYDTTETPELFLTMHLSPLPFYKRLVNGIKYIFGYRSVFGDFDETIVSPESVTQIKNLCEKYEELYKKIK